MNSDKKKVLIELVKELILSTMADDAKIKELDESVVRQLIFQLI